MGKVHGWGRLQNEWNKSSIHFIHQQIANGKVDFEKIGTHLNMADSGTKPNPLPAHFWQFDQGIGVRFYPPADSEHHKLLELDKFVVSPYTKPYSVYCLQYPILNNLFHYTSRDLLITSK